MVLAVAVMGGLAFDFTETDRYKTWAADLVSGPGGDVTADGLR